MVNILRAEISFVVTHSDSHVLETSHSTDKW